MSRSGIRFAGSSIGAVLCLGIAAVFLLPIALEILHERAQRIPFESATWKADPDSSNPVRTRMVDDLLARSDFHGVARDDVVALLGDPSASGYFSDWDLVYRLGNERGSLSVDSEWLVFRLDADGKVSDYRIVTD